MFTSTADFDAWLKSQSSGNREVITETDVVTGAANAPATGTLELENLFSDKFDVADADGLTYKLRQSVALASSGTYAQNIDTTVNDAFYQSVGGGAAGAVNTGLTQYLTGDFSVQVKLDITNFPASNTGWALFTLMTDADNYMVIYRYKGASVNQLIFARASGGVATQDILTPCTDDTVSFRLRRVGTTLYGAYDLNQGETWTEWTKTSDFTTDVEVIFRFLSSGNTDVRDGYWRDYKINSGAFTSGGWRTSGNGTSPAHTNSTAISQVDVTLANGDASNYVNIVILDASNDSEITRANGIQTTQSLVTGDFNNGLAGTNKNYKVKVEAVGSGAKSVALQEIGITYASGGIYTSRTILIPGLIQ